MSDGGPFRLWVAKDGGYWRVFEAPRPITPHRYRVFPPCFTAKRHAKRWLRNYVRALRDEWEWEKEHE